MDVPKVATTACLDELATPSSVGSPTSGPSLPVKNTFIHFEGPCQQSSRRGLRRWRTDPEEPPQRVLSGMKSERASTASLAPSSVGSTVEPASEADVLDATIGSLRVLDLEGFNSPETTPRCVRDPWASSPQTSSPPQLQATVTSPSSPFGTHVQASPVLTPLTSASSSLSSSPASSIYVDAATNLLSEGRRTQFLEGGYCFSFTLRLADDVGLGVDLVASWDGSQALCIQEILQNGAVAAWNKQCFDGTSMRLKAVWPGDTIVAVNGKMEYLDMLDECKHKMLLKLTVFRHDSAAVPTDCYWSSLQAGGFMVKNQGCEGERLHSCKKPVLLSTKH